MAADDKPVWRSDAFIAHLADKFIGGTALEAGHIANAIAYLRYLLDKLAPVPADGAPLPAKHPLLNTFAEQEVQALVDVQELLERAHPIATAQPQEATDVTKLIADWTGQLRGLRIGQSCFVPGGWVGLRSSNAVMHVVEKTGEGQYAFVTCNVAAGLAYHPSKPGPTPKMLYKTAIRIEGIPQMRMADPAFWTLLFSQWMKQPPSEYHRQEVLYDVLLPWLADRLLPLALIDTEADPRATWATPARSGTSFFGSALEAVLYFLRGRGLTANHLKELTLAFRALALTKAHEDLKVLADPEAALRDGLALGLAPAPHPDGIGVLQPAILRQLLAGSLLQHDGSLVPASSLEDCIVGLYFGGGWCGPCTSFRPLLQSAHATVRRRRQQWTIIYVSLDKTAEEFAATFASMPEEFVAIPYHDEEVRQRMGSMFEVTAIPTLAMLGPGGRLYTMKGVSAIKRDPECLGFPWTPSALAAAAATRGPVPLESHDTLLLQWASQNYISAIIKAHAAGRIDASGLIVAQTHVQRLCVLAAALPGGQTLRQALELDDLALSDVSDEMSDEGDKDPKRARGMQLQSESSPAVGQPAVRAEGRVGRQPLAGGELLLTSADEGRYAGVLAVPTPPQPVNILDLPEAVNNIMEAVQALETAQRICYLILDRARESSTASRLVLQYEILALIGHLFTRVLPRPTGADVMAMAAGGPAEASVWATALPAVLQLRALEHVYHLALVYGQMWQAVEQAPRDSDCERTLVIACILTVYDALLRRPALDNPLALSLMLSESGGYRLSTTLCQANVPFSNIAARLEVRSPDMLEARSNVLDYFAAQHRVYRNVLFELRQPDKIEVKKYGTTLLFLRGLLERLGYELMPRDQRGPKSEIEVLAEWMVGESTQLATDHSEWAMTRDMVAIFKFLSTMESKEAELMRHRKEKQSFAWWSLTFDEGGRRGWWGSLRGKPLKWEAVNFRGVDMDTADLEVVGFGDRRLIFGEGPAIKSPASVSRFLGLEFPTEDDVLHCDALPNFNGTLSREESEQLMSYLTVDYVRIPLILGFFASRDRVTYLFNPALQLLLRAVLFEGGDWVAQTSSRPIPQIPIRMSHEQHRQHKLKLLREGKPQPETEELGTPLGLLYNELIHSPAATAHAIISMLHATRPLHAASPHSADASFLLYMTLLAIDAEAYARTALAAGASDDTTREALHTFLNSLAGFLRGDMQAVLQEWLIELDAEDDLVSSCVVRAFLALLWTNVPTESLGRTEVVGFLANFLFVRNWHNFGLDFATVATSGAHDEGLTPEDRLLRFLQAHGVDTARIKAADLQKYLKGKPLFLSVGGVTVRAPTLIDNKTASQKKLPPTTVPEYRLLVLHHRLRRTLCDFLRRAEAAHELDNVLEEIMRVALRSPRFEDAGWRGDGPGRFLSPKTELKLDLQTGEVLWRNDDLKPVPDSISQFSDYQAMFRGAALHCGVVAKQQRRQWVHVVGSKYDLIEWDEPDTVDQGVGCPTAVPATGSLTLDDVPPARREAAAQLHAALGFDLNSCVAALRVSDDNMEEAGNRLLSGGVIEEVEDVEAPATLMGHLENRYRRADAPTVVEFAERAYYRNVIYERHFDPYDERPHCGLEPVEHWIADVLQPVLLAVYPPFPPDKMMTYKLMLPTAVTSSDANEVRLLGCSSHDKEDATWKEVVVYRARRLVLAYNLVSHGRRMYRSLIYTSNHRFSLHSLTPNIDPSSAPRPPTLLKQAGSFRSNRLHEPSLLIVRRNTTIGGHETLQPKRLLAGLIPGALLESHHFWRGEDGHLRGEPVESDSQWFNYNVHVRILPLRTTGSTTSTQVHVRRLSLKQHIPVANARERVTEGNMLVRKSSASRPTPVAVRYDAESVAELVALGFSAAAARRALRETKHNKAWAANWLFDPANYVSVSEAPQEEAAQRRDAAEPAVIDDALLESLTNMGFSQPAARHALTIYGDLEPALSWLADDGNADEIARLEESAALAETGASAAPEPQEVDQDVDMAGEVTTELVTEEDVSLLDLLAVAPGTALYRLATVLTRIEDLSHILVWARGSLDHPDVPVDVATIELPRLKIRFEVQRDDENQLRLALLDQAGWYVSDVLDRPEPTSFVVPTECRRRLAALMEGLDHALLLDDGNGSFMVFVPNHNLHRPPVEGAPFSGALVQDRGALGWLATMDTRYYLYTVHASFNHLNSSSLASTLYMVLLRLLSRHYEQAFAWVEAASSDTELTPEEAWVFEQLERTVDDRHPEAIAVRIKLSLALMYSDTPSKWELHQELDDYLCKLPGVGAACRLTPEEELSALMLCKQMTPVLKNRLAIIQAALGRETGKKRVRPDISDNVRPPHGHVTLKPAPLRWGGQPWAKVQTISLDYLVRSAPPLTRLQFRPPGATPTVLEDAELLAVLWDDNLVGDEESGSNRQLGFLFLYAVVLRLLPCRFENMQINDSFGELATRLFQLKLARWGKEAAAQGEQEYVTSKQMVLLANMLGPAGAGASWPPPPQDPASLRMLAAGVNLYTPPGRDSEVKQWVDMLDLVFRSVLTDPAHNFVVTAQIEAFAAVRAHPLAASIHAQALLWGEALAAQPLKLKDTGCHARRVTASDVASAADVHAYGSRPLAVLGDLDHWLVYEPTPGNARASSTLPFALESHPSAQSVVSAELLARLAEDVADFAQAHNESKKPHLRGMRPSDMTVIASDGRPRLVEKSVAAALASLRHLRVRMRSQQAEDQAYVAASLEAMTAAINRIGLGEAGQTFDPVDRVLFKLRRLARQRPRIHSAHLLAALASTEAEVDLRRGNPFVANVDVVLHTTMVILLRCSRSAQLGRALAAAASVERILGQLLGAAQTDVVPYLIGLDLQLQRLDQEQAALAAVIAAQRHYAVQDATRGDAAMAIALDPRFLLSEFLFGILLRRRQVEIVIQMATAAQAGHSKVQQMIMGAGKTTVVGPLLSLLLADGQRLVVQVMPTALLAQTRDVLRARFSAVVQKRILTLQFDRSIEDVEAVALLFDKLESARRRGDVVCAPPEAVKSLMLKFVEELERLESFDMDSLVPNESMRNNREVSRLRDQLANRSAVADGVCSLLDMLNRDGVLIMDEVDVILNPLKLELNFPIGASQAMPGYRWDLFIHIVDALFYVA